jgi:hypothetical protein
MSSNGHPRIARVMVVIGRQRATHGNARHARNPVSCAALHGSGRCGAVVSITPEAQVGKANDVRALGLAPRASRLAHFRIIGVAPRLPPALSGSVSWSARQRPQDELHFTAGRLAGQGPVLPALGPRVSKQTGGALQRSSEVMQVTQLAEIGVGGYRQ